MKNKNIVLIVLFVIIKVFLFGNEEKEKLLQRKRKLEAEIELATKLLEETKNKRNLSVQQLKILQSRITKRRKLINQYRNNIARINSDIQEKQERLESYLLNLDKITNEYAGLIYHSFKNKNGNIDLMYLLASDNINQIYSRFIYLQQYKEYRLKNIRMIKQLKRLIEVEIISLTNIKTEKTNILNDIIAENAVLLEDKKQVRNVVRSLEKEESEILSELNEKKELTKKLDKQIEQIIKNESKRNKYNNLTPEDKLISNDFKTNKGRLPWPTAQGIITDGFGEHPHPAIKDLMIRNNGIDITTTNRSQARAIFEGEVAKIFSIKGANSTVILRHGNFYTVYHNLSDVVVLAGDKVKTKQVLGTVFTDAKSKQTVLHFELWEEMEKMNPEEWLAN